MTRSEAFYERLYRFAISSLTLIRTLPKQSYNTEYGKQLIRSSASVGANYIEALEGLSKKDFAHRLRICRKETRESVHWLRLIKDANSSNEDIPAVAQKLIDEADQIKRILSSSIITLEK